MARLLGVLLLPLLWARALPSSELLRYRVDASAEGCTGLFWRAWSEAEGTYVTDMTVRRTDSPPWPRNGAIVEGTRSEHDPRFLQVSGGMALPFRDAEGRFTYLHEISERGVGAAPAFLSPVHDKVLSTSVRS